MKKTLAICAIAALAFAASAKDAPIASPAARDLARAYRKNPAPETMAALRSQV